MKTLNQTQFAKHLGVDRSRVTQLKQAGRLVFAENGRVDVEASEIKIKETADPNRDDVVARHAQARGKDTQAGEIGQIDIEQASTIKALKPKKEPKPHDPNHKSLQAELEYKKTIGELVSLEDMKAAVADMVTTFRQELENMPHRLAPDLVAKDINLIRSMLKQEVHTVLANLERECGTKIHHLTEISL
jgi:hypothetical protein